METVLDPVWRLFRRVLIHSLKIFNQILCIFYMYLVPMQLRSQFFSELETKFLNKSMRLPQGRSLL